MSAPSVKYQLNRKFKTLFTTFAFFLPSAADDLVFPVHESIFPSTKRFLRKNALDVVLLGIFLFPLQCTPSILPLLAGGGIRWGKFYIPEDSGYKRIALYVGLY